MRTCGLLSGRSVHHKVGIGVTVAYACEAVEGAENTLGVARKSIGDKGYCRAERSATEDRGHMLKTTPALQAAEKEEFVLRHALRQFPQLMSGCRLHRRLFSSCSLWLKQYSVGVAEQRQQDVVYGRHSLIEIDAGVGGHAARTQDLVPGRHTHSQRQTASARRR